MTISVGFIGLGNMGCPMASNILRAGYQLKVWDIRQEAVNTLVNAGAVAAEGPSRIMAESEVVFLSLPGPSEMEQTVLGAQGLLTCTHVTARAIFDMSTIDPYTSRRVSQECSERGVLFVDSPVSGGVAKAADASLTIMVGASESEVLEFTPLLKAIGSAIKFVGVRGGGSTMKIVNNLLSMSYMATLAEAICMTAKMGIPLTTLYDIVSTSTGMSAVFASKYAKIRNRDWSPSFRVDLAAKDLELAVQLGKDTKVPAFMTSTAQQFYKLAQARGMGDKDLSSIIAMMEEISGCRIETT